MSALRSKTFFLAALLAVFGAARFAPLPHPAHGVLFSAVEHAPAHVAPAMQHARPHVPAVRLVLLPAVRGEAAQPCRFAQVEVVRCAMHVAQRDPAVTTTIPPPQA